MSPYQKILSQSNGTMDQFIDTRRGRVNARQVDVLIIAGPCGYLDGLVLNRREIELKETQCGVKHLHRRASELESLTF